MIKIIVFFFTVAYAHLNSTITLKSVLKGKRDNNAYKAIRLSNQIECLLISNPSVGISSAGLSVAVGASEDPIDKQGLAHYVEHLLFMGSQKYPKEDEFSNVNNKK